MQPYMNELTTVVSTMPFAFWQKRAVISNKKAALRSDLCFHIVLKFENAMFSELERSRFERYIVGFIGAAGATKETVGLSGGRVHLLIGLPQTYAPADFVRQFKLLSRTFARRKLNAENFVWQEEYDAFTVSSSEIEPVKSYIRRHIRLEKQETYASSWIRISKDKLF